MNSFESRILAFIQRELLHDRPVDISEDTYLFDEGLIDSLKILQLIAFLEVETDRPIPDRDIVMEHFRTVKAMAARFASRSA
jgi:acyl carrier protein